MCGRITVDDYPAPGLTDYASGVDDHSAKRLVPQLDRALAHLERPFHESVVIKRLGLGYARAISRRSADAS
jgi:hypothetical protein